MKQLSKIVAIALAGVMLAGCMSKEAYQESLREFPNNGVIEFRNVTLTIPDDYVRDTTMQGTEEGIARRWEQGNYKKIVTISAHDKYEINEEELEKIKVEQGKISSTGEVEASLIDFNGDKAIESVIPISGGELRYLIFNAAEEGYDFSVQGDTSDYETIRDSIVLWRE